MVRAVKFEKQIEKGKRTELEQIFDECTWRKKQKNMKSFKENDGWLKEALVNGYSDGQQSQMPREVFES